MFYVLFMKFLLSLASQILFSVGFLGISSCIYAQLRIQPKIWEEIVYRYFLFFLLHFFLFETLSFTSQTLWPPPNPDLYPLSLGKLIFIPQLSPTHILTRLSRITDPQILPAFIACQGLLTVVSDTCCFTFFVVFTEGLASE